MLRPKQVVPGVADTNRQTFSLGTHMGHDLLAHSTGSTVIVSSRELGVLQQLQVEGPVVALTWSARGKLAVATLERVLVVQARVQEQLGAVVELVRVGSVEQRGVSALAWQHAAEHLLVGVSAHSLALWSFEGASVGEQLWLQPLRCPVSHLQYSPCDTFLAGGHTDDQLLKVWYWSKLFEQLCFVYLAHPAPVTYCEWRQHDERSYCVLLTNCRDDVVRIWAEVQVAPVEGVELAPRFSLCSLLDTPEANAGTISVTWLRVGDIPFVRDENLSERLRARHKEHGKPIIQGWVLGIASNCKVLLWAINHLETRPAQRFPVAYIWKQMPTLPKDQACPRKVIGLGHILDSDAGGGPPRLSVYTLTTRGSIESWRFNTRDGSAASCVLTGSSWGHSAPIVSVSTLRSHVFSVDAQGRAIVWKTRSSRILDPALLLREEILLDFPVSVATWLPLRNHHVLATVDKQGMLRVLRYLGKGEYKCTLQLEVGSACSLSLLSVDLFPAIALAGVSAETQDVTLWLLDIALTGDMSVSRSRVIAGHNVCCADVAPSSSDERSAYQLLVGTTTGNVELWHLDPQLELSVKGKFLAAEHEDTPITSVGCAFFGRFATHAKGSSSLNVWQLEAHISRIELEGSIPVEASPTTRLIFSWIPLSNGRHMLMLAQGHQIDLYLSVGATGLRSFTVSWVKVASTTSMHAKPTSVTWCSASGTLVVGSSREMCLFSKWLHGDDAYGDVLAKAADIQAPLPLYHPKVLTMYLMGGRHVELERILHHLLVVLRHRGHGSSHVHVPPLPLHDVVKLSGESQQEHVQSEQTAANLMDFLSSEPLEASASPKQPEVDSFSVSDAQELSALLMQVTLPGVSRKDQLNLLAVLDTFRQIKALGGGLDEAATRFMLSVKLFQFTSRTRTTQLSPLSACDWAWAMQSDAHQTLLEQCLPQSKLTWQHVQDMGVALWLRDPGLVQKLAEKLAKMQYMERKEPFDCALLYIALGRKRVLSSMFKVAKQQKVADFLLNDFNEPRWLKAAGTNAYALQKKLEFHSAASFWLLAGKLKDCIKIILAHLKDFHLALFVCRLVEGGENGEVFRWVLHEHINPLCERQGLPWLLSISKWLQHDYEASLRCLTNVIAWQKEEGESEYQYTLMASKSNEFDPTILPYIEHLLSRTQLVKSTSAGLDEHSSRRLTRRIVAAMLNCGAVTLGLDAALAHKHRFGATMDREGEAQLNPRLAMHAMEGVLEYSSGMYEESESWSEPRDLINDTATFLSEGTGVDPKELMHRFTSMCQSHSLLRPQYALLTEDVKCVQFLSFYALEIVFAISQSLSNNHPVRAAQASQLEVLSNALHDCAKHLAAHSKLPQLVQRDVVVAVLTGRFFSALVLCDYEAQEHLFGWNLEAPFEDVPRTEDTHDATMMEDDVQEGAAALASSEEEPFVLELVAYMQLHFFVERVGHMLASTPEESETKSERSVHQLHATLLPYMKEVQENLRSHFYMCKLLLNLSPTKPLFELLTDMLRDSTVYKTNGAFRHMLGSLWTRSNFGEVAERCNLQLVETSVSCMGADVELRFGPEVTLMQDQDMLLSFCVSCYNPHDIAIATMRGIAEVDEAKILDLADDKGRSGELRSTPESKSKRRARKPLVQMAERPNLEVITLTRPQQAVYLKSHPLHPYYLSAEADGGLHLFQFGLPRLNTYREGPNPRVTRVNFNTMGTRFAIVDAKGNFGLWQFSAAKSSHAPVRFLQAHSRKGLDVCFIDSRSIVATAGISETSHLNVCLWDPLVPQKRACVAAFECHRGRGASALAYSAKHQLLVSGGKDGTLCLWDVRQRKLLGAPVAAHSSTISSLSVEANQSFVMSGSSDGNVKVWNMPDLVERAVFEDVHRRRQFVRTRTTAQLLEKAAEKAGVKQVSWDRDRVISCGADGRLCVKQYHLGIKE